MYNNMSDSESESSEEHSSSECSTDSSDDDKLETVQFKDFKMQIPQGLCEKKEIFDEFFSAHTWNALSEANRQHLRQFLPKFPENEQIEQNITLQRLFNRENFKFSSPLDNFYEHLKAGHYRPDIAQMRQLIRNAERRESIWRHKKFKEKLEAELRESRGDLVKQIYNLPPGVEPALPKPVFSSNSNPINHRTKRRYFQVLASIRSKVDESGFSSDENYPEGPPTAISRKEKRILNSIKNSQVLNGEKVIVSTMAHKSSGFDLEKNITTNCNPYIISEQTYKTILLQHKKRKVQFTDFDYSDLSISDVIQRARVNYNKKEKLVMKAEVKVPKKKVKKEIVVNSFSPEIPYSSESDSDSVLDNLPKPVPVRTAEKKKPAVPVKTSLSPKPVPVPFENVKQEVVLEEIKSEPVENDYIHYDKITPATLSDLDGIDMMKLPIDLQDSNIDILDITTKAELMQDTHANFLSLIRDIICSTPEHRMNMSTLEERLKSWQENPITALNDWYCLADNWLVDLQSAINFLSGNFSEQPDDFVPYIEYKQSLNMYQWIGAGRDSDNLLGPLFQYWLERKNDMKPVISIKEKEGDKTDVDLEILDHSLSPPAPRCPTDWQVRKADEQEIKAFREQEKRRYDNPHKSFTYRCNGYESVVGPLKGIYNPNTGNTKARGHTMLSADRPNFVTILSLVRDATARLPNGEGTRADICELLKCSQYISSTAPDNILQSVVSGALDRMHTQFDPCVKYDPKRKIWIYLHRNRSEEDFDRIHQQYQGMNKTIKKTPKPKGPPKPKVPKVEKSKNNAKMPTAEDADKPKTKPNATLPEAKQNSLLIPQNAITQQQHNSSVKELLIETLKKENLEPKERIMTAEEREINEALQSITPIVSPVKPVNKSNIKNLVKIISSNQAGKSLIIPSSANAIIKQAGSAEVRTVPTKSNNNATISTQQLVQNLAQQKQINPQQLIRVEVADNKEQNKKTNLSIQQQILQSISPQQLHNIKNVTLLRNIRQNQAPIVIAQNEEVVASGGGDTKGDNSMEGNPQPIRVQQGLSLSTQQQLLQTIRQKGLATVGGQQVLIRHKAPIQKTVQAAPGTSLLGETKVVTDAKVTNKQVMSTSQTPIVAKVLTNAAGHVISVESLLAHQKQHGSLPQGTTLRVSGVKGGTNIIQLAPSSHRKSSQGVTQVGMGAQNNFITLTNQPKLVLSSAATTTLTATLTTTKPLTKTVSKVQTLSKFPSKVAQQLINAKLIAQNVDSNQHQQQQQKMVHPKVIIGQNQIKLSNKVPKTVNVAANNNAIRMVSASNLNLAHLSGKPVLLASKGSSLQNMHGQNIIIQTQANSSGSSLLNAAARTKNSAASTGSLNVINQSGQVVLAPQIKMQTPMLLSSNVKNSNLIQTPGSTNQIIVGGHPVRLQTSTANAQRVVLTSQGQGGQILAQQILLPPGFQGTAINIKSLPGVKVIPIAQSQQHKGMQGRQVYARVMNPASIVRSTSVSTTSEGHLQQQQQQQQQNSMAPTTE